MEKANFTNYDFTKLNPIYTGVESNIYKIDDYMVKIFKTNDLDVLNNKREKIELLSSLPIECKPILAIEKNGINIGYAMKQEKEFYRIADKLLLTKKSLKIEDLKKIKEALDKLHKYGIIYGDLSLNNILTDGENFYFCDLDNCYIDKYGFDMPNYNQQIYLKRVHEIDEKIDDFMFNILTIGYTYNIVLPCVLPYLRDYDIPFRFNNKENREIVNNMLFISDKNKDNLDLFINHVKTLKKTK